LGDEAGRALEGGLLTTSGSPTGGRPTSHRTLYGGLWRLSEERRVRAPRRESAQTRRALNSRSEALSGAAHENHGALPPLGVHAEHANGQHRVPMLASRYCASSLRSGFLVNVVR